MSVFTVKAALVSGAIALASVFAVGTSAQAAPNVTLTVATGGVQYGAPVTQVNHRHGHYQGPSYGHRPNYRPNHYRQACSPRDAASKASRMGLRNVRVSNNRSTIRASGFRHGRPAVVVFGKSRGCPILR